MHCCGQMNTVTSRLSLALTRPTVASTPSNFLCCVYGMASRHAKQDRGTVMFARRIFPETSRLPQPPHPFLRRAPFDAYVYTYIYVCTSPYTHVPCTAARRAQSWARVVCAEKFTISVNPQLREHRWSARCFTLICTAMLLCSVCVKEKG